MKKEDLQPCPKCGGTDLFFPERGRVSCNKQSCMPWKEIYTYEEWNNLPKYETVASLRSQIAEAQAEVARLKKIVDLDTQARTITYIKENRANVDRLNP